MIEELLAVIAGKHHQRIETDAKLVEFLQQTCDFLVHPTDRTVIPSLFAFYVLRRIQAGSHYLPPTRHGEAMHQGIMDLLAHRLDSEQVLSTRLSIHPQAIVRRTGPVGREGIQEMEKHEERNVPVLLQPGHETIDILSGCLARTIIGQRHRFVEFVESTVGIAMSSREVDGRKPER
jgi:hypothetical protein